MVGLLFHALQFPPSNRVGKLSRGLGCSALLFAIMSVSTAFAANEQLLAQASNPGDYWAGSSQPQYQSHTNTSIDNQPMWRGTEAVSNSFNSNSQSVYGQTQPRQYVSKPLHPQFRPRDDEPLPQSQVFDGQVFKQFGSSLPAFRPIDGELPTDKINKLPRSSGEEPGALPGTEIVKPALNNYGYGAYPASGYPVQSYPGVGYSRMHSNPYTNEGYRNFPVAPGAMGTPWGLGFPGFDNANQGHRSPTVPFW